MSAWEARQPVDQCVILVDNTNLFIGGQQLAAERKGVKQRRGKHDAPSDPSWRLDFSGLYCSLADGRTVNAAVMVGSRDPDDECVWEDEARAAGFAVVVQNTNGNHQEKAVDTELVARGTEIICTADEPMVLVLASGDRDYVPLVDVAHRNGWRVELCAFRASFSRHGELASRVHRVRPLDDCFSAISRDGCEGPQQAKARKTRPSD
jgi:uncharacterized LabA/DUF88 family protein